MEDFRNGECADPSAYVRDDVGMYLRDIGQLPILSHAEQVKCAQAMERTHADFCMTLFEHGTAARAALSLLTAVQRGEIEIVSALWPAKHSSGPTEERIRATLAQNLETASKLVSALDAATSSACAPCQGQQSTSPDRIARQREHLCRILAEFPFKKDIVRGWWETIRQSPLQNGCTQRLGTWNSSVSAHKIMERLQKTHAEYLRARSALCDSNLRLVVKIAKKFRGRGLSFADLTQEGNNGLVRAAETYEWQLGYTLTTYATPWIRQHIQRALANCARAIRIPTHLQGQYEEYDRALAMFQHLHGRLPIDNEIIAMLPGGKKQLCTVRHVASATNIMSLDAPLVPNGDDNCLTPGDVLADRDGSPDVLTTAADLHHITHTMLKELLEPREQEVIMLRFGLNGEEQKTLREIGKVLGITRERVRQIEIKAIEKLRRRKGRLASFLD